MNNKNIKTINEKDTFFTYTICDELITLPENMPCVEQVVSIIVEPEIISKRIINTIEGLSAEGVYLSGKKIISYVKLKQKILFKETSDSLYVYENEYFTTISVVIPSKIKGSNLDDLIKYNYLKLDVKVHNVDIEKFNNHTLYKNICLFTNVYLIPTYELTYLLNYNKKKSNILVCYEDGSNAKQITPSKMNNNIFPVWSPNGWEIAFLSKTMNSNKYMLYIYSLHNNKIKSVIKKDIFDNISSFSWSNDGNEIVFSGTVDNIKDLYGININSLELKKLTHNTNGIKSYKPKYNPDSKTIAFLQSISAISNLYTIKNNNSLCITKLTDCGFIKDYCWSNNGKYIAYITGKNNNNDKIFLLNTLNQKTQIINIPNYLIKLKNIKFSPNNKYITFIGSNLITENIFNYNIITQNIKNLTRNYSNIIISSFEWNIDCNKIYYSANDLQYYNIYFIDLNDLSIKPITNTTAVTIKIDCRPKII